LRVWLDGAGGKVAKVETINDTLLECRGLLFAHGSLYANANNSKALYRLRDTNGDDRLDEVTLLKKTGGGVGHGRNDLALGPDGMIYLIHGDSVQIPEGSSFRTPPLAETFRREGHLVRTDAGGTRWEIVSTGLRNPFGIDFNPEGEPFTYDADNESDMGLPFYRPTRVNHLVSGADYGWRQGGNSWPVHAPDSLPTTIDIGHGSPTAVKFGTRSNFPPAYRRALFILDWAYGRIISVHTVPRGASYLCRAETFLRGRPLNVTDLDFGSEGAMYFVTGGRKTRSALYRIRYTGQAVNAEPPTSQERARAEYSRRARILRLELERWHQPGTGPAVLDPIWLQLGSPDPWIRHAARTALEHQPVASWRDRALGAAASPALLALARVGGAEDLPKVVGALTGLDYGGFGVRERLEMLRTCEVCLRRMGSFGEETRTGLISRFEPHFPARRPDENRELARMLVTLGSPLAVPKCLALLAQAESQQEQLHYLELLSRAGGSPWTMPQRMTFWRSLVRARAFDGDRSLAGYVDGIRKRALASLSAADRLTLGELVEWKGGERVPTPEAGGRKLVAHWTIGELSRGLAGVEGRPSFTRGKEMYAAALCVHCHQMGATGVPVGPNLTAVASRFGRDDLLEAIVDPSRVVAEVFRNHVIVMAGESRETVMGRVIQNDFRQSVVTLATNPFAPWQITRVAKNEIASHEISPVSPMPPGLLDTL
ncbi:MAG: c-type cytochrome, partial [Akkermansiaceae bacterium]|nr:c-type cytochrome [Akkermansiaceae bacterium]